MNVEGILARLRGVKRSKDGYTALCPSHDDQRNSLSIKPTTDRILLNCFAGCPIEQICIHLGIEMNDLFFSNGTAAPKIVATYDYTDEKGALLYQVVRTEPKRFFQRHRGRNGEWINKMDGVRRVLYHLPEVLASPGPIYVFEGEKDVDNAREWGLVATCNSGGAGKGKWLSGYSESMRGKPAVICNDADPPGREHADRIAPSLKSYNAPSIKMIEFPGAKDFSEWKEQGGTKEQFLELVRQTPEWTPPAEDQPGRAGSQTTSDPEKLFRTPEQWEQTGPLTFVIERFMPNRAVTAVGGLSGDGKTLFMLSAGKALLGEYPQKLFGIFDVPKGMARIIYLIPECTAEEFKKRVITFDLYKYLLNGRLLVRTLSEGPTISLTDPGLLHITKNCGLVLDTAIRFMKGDEVKATDNQKGFGNDVFRLLASGTRFILFAHHSPKAARGAEEMTLENMLRGTGDLGAICAAVHGVKMIDPDQNIFHIETLKGRDFQKTKPFQLIGGPELKLLEETHNLQLHKAPGQCGSYAEENPNPSNADKKNARQDRIDMARKLLSEDPNISAQEMVEKFKAMGLKVSLRSMKYYRKEVRKGAV
jgi:hypothetical protein